MRIDGKAVDKKGGVNKTKCQYYILPLLVYYNLTKKIQQGN